MNLRQPYEQLIADKLRKLPAPDADASWQQMKQLLNDDEDRGGGAKRPPGNKNGWWRMGIIAILLSTSLWFYVEKASSKAPLAINNTTAPPSANNKPAEKGNGSLKNITTPTNNKTATIDNNNTLPVTNATTTIKNDDKINTGVIDKPNAANSSKNNNRVNNTASADMVKTSKTKLEKQTRAEANNILLNKPAVERKNAVAKNSNTHLYAAENKGVENKKFTGINRNNNSSTNIVRAGNANDDDKTLDITGNAQSAYTKGNHSRKEKLIAGNGPTNNKYSSTSFLAVNQTTGIENKKWFGEITNPEIPFAIPSANTSLAIGDSIQSYLNTSNLLNNETKKQVAKALRDKELEDMSRKEKKSFHLNLSDVFKPFSLHIDTDPRWAAGISLNSSVTVNAQSRYNYNMNAKSGTLTDYIPSLYLQFHLNDYVYAQTEINFISPQYTPQLLVYQHSNSLTGQPNGTSQQKTIYIQKLYYFNLPVSLHYSPINNFYFSAGLQFSSFQSGLVSIQQKQYATLTGPDHATSISNSVVKFKDDSIAAKLSPNEWRWQVGADYYWNRFSFGMRYNKSFKDLLNVNLSSSLPPTTLRNQSLIFFVRYNLFESRKKGEPSQKN